MTENEGDHHPVADFFKGIFLGTLTVISGFFITLLGLSVLKFPLAAGIVVGIPFLMGISFWVVSKRKFLALGCFMSLPIVFYIFYSLCGPFFEIE